MLRHISGDDALSYQGELHCFYQSFFACVCLLAATRSFRLGIESIHPNHHLKHLLSCNNQCSCLSNLRKIACSSIVTHCRDINLLYAVYLDMLCNSCKQRNNATFPTCSLDTLLYCRQTPRLGCGISILGALSSTVVFLPSMSRVSQAKHLSV